MLRAIAIDDEPLALEIISNHASKVDFINLEACFTKSSEARAFMQSSQPDLLFLDIKMPDINGIDFISGIANPPMTIFTTAYSEHAVKGFELNAVDYLLKPFSEKRFKEACQKAFDQFILKKNSLHEEDTSFFVKSGFEQIRIKPSSILYIQSAGNYIHFITEDSKVTTRLTMTEVESLFKDRLFTRIHRSYIVSNKHIQRIEKSCVWIRGVKLPIGSGYLEVVERIMGNF